jgi:hypothetical protein
MIAKIEIVIGNENLNVIENGNVTNVVYHK